MKRCPTCGCPMFRVCIVERVIDLVTNHCTTSDDYHPIQCVPLIGTTVIFHLIGSLEIHAEYTVVSLIVAAWVLYFIKEVHSWIA